jgi:hypothetical protein
LWIFWILVVKWDQYSFSFLFFLFFFFNFLAVQDIEFKAYACYAGTLPLELCPKFFFTFSYSLDWVLCFLPRPGLRLWSFYLCLLHRWNYRCILLYLAYLLRGALTNCFCQSWIQTEVLPISTSWVAGIIDVYYWVFFSTFCILDGN